MKNTHPVPKKEAGAPGKGAAIVTRPAKSDNSASEPADLVTVEHGQPVNTTERIASVQTIPFHGLSLSAILVSGAPYVAIRPICEALGIPANRGSQVTEAQRVRADAAPVFFKEFFIRYSCGGSGARPRPEAPASCTVETVPPPHQSRPRAVQPGRAPTIWRTCAGWSGLALMTW
jgi:hypothetical protein